MPTKKLDKHYLIDRNDIIHANKIGITFGRHIGSGMYANVFYCKFNARRVALKATIRSKCVRKTFDTEIQVSNILKNKSHKNVVQFLEVFHNWDNGQSWILMEWVDGQDMFEIQSRNNKAFEEKVAKDYFRQLVAGLKFLHSLGIVHRDIKPHNILIVHKSDGQDTDVIKYIDFGFAKNVLIDTQSKAICSSHKGSQIYMAPELMSDKTLIYDAFKTDIYSLAIVLYEMLFDTLPFATSDLGIDRDERNDLMQKLKENLIIKYPVNSDVSENAKQLIENMICGESSQRYSLQQIIDSKWLNI